MDLYVFFINGVPHKITESGMFLTDNLTATERSLTATAQSALSRESMLEARSRLPKNL